MQMVGRVVAQSNELEAKAGALSGAIGHFKLQQGVAEEAIALVERAVAYRRQVGSLEAFFQGLTEKSNNFHDRDMYVFILDHLGTYRAFGGNPAKLGTRVQGIAGVDGQGLLDKIMKQAVIQPGWVEYDIVNPSTGVVQFKMSYVQEIEGVYIGCGVYKNLMAS